MTSPDAQRGPLGALIRGTTCLAALCVATLLTGCRNKEPFASVTAQSNAETQGGLTVTRIAGTAAGEGSAESAGQLLARGAARLASTFAPQGRPLFAPVPWKFTKADRRDLPVKLTQGMRVAFMAYAQPSDIDLDLVLTLPDGLQAAEDRSPDEMPVIVHFEAPRDGIYNLRVSADGAGEALILGLEEATMPETFAGRDLQALANRYLPAATALSPVHRESLLPGHSARLTFAALAGHCYGVVAVGSKELIDLDLYLATAEGQELDEDTGPAPDVVIPEVCMDHAGMNTVTLRAAEGKGDAFWQVYERARRLKPSAHAGSGGAEK